METKSDKSSQQKHWAIKIISHPATGFVVGITGIFLAICFYYAGLAKPKLILLLHPVRSPIVQKGQLSKLSVFLDGKPISGDLTVAQFALWNSGKAPVRHEDILKPIVLMTSSNCPIYEATIRHVSRDVIGFELITNDMASGRLGFDWKILEHNDGASVQILYGGDQKLSFAEVGGIVVGQNRVPFQLLITGNTGVIGKVIIAAALGALAFGCMGATKNHFKKLLKAIQQRIVRDCVYAALWVLVSGTLALLFLISSLAVIMGNNAPPFDF